MSNIVGLSAPKNMHQKSLLPGGTEQQTEKKKNILNKSSIPLAGRKSNDAERENSGASQKARQHH